MRLVGFFAIIFLLTSQEILAQTLDNAAHSDYYSVGVPRYVPPAIARYRLTFGGGFNLGRKDDALYSMVGSASYQSGHTLFGAGFVSSTNNAQQPPYNTLSEFDLLFGYALDEPLAQYEARPSTFHASFSAGVGLQSYDQRWHRGRRGFQQDSLFFFQPNTFQFAASLPVQIQAVYEPLAYVGIGTMLFLSVSRFTPSYGASVFLEARY